MRFGARHRREPYSKRHRPLLHKLIYKCRLPCLRHLPDTESILSERVSLVTDLVEEQDELEEQEDLWGSNYAIFNQVFHLQGCNNQVGAFGFDQCIIYRSMYDTSIDVYPHFLLTWRLYV